MQLEKREINEVVKSSSKIVIVLTTAGGGSFVRRLPFLLG